MLRVNERGFISAVIIQKYEEPRHFLASKVLMGYFYFFSLCLTSQKAPNFYTFLLRNRKINTFPVGWGRGESLRRIPSWLCSFVHTGNITRKDIRLFRGNPGAESGLRTFSLLFAQLVLHEMHLLDIDLHLDRYQAITARGTVLFYLVQSHNTENWKQIFPGKELRGYSPNSYIHVSASDLYWSAYSAAGK